MLRNSLLIVICFLQKAAVAQLLNITSVTAPANVARRAKCEVTVELSRSYLDPYDPDQIRVYGEFTSPTGAVMVVDGFIFTEYTRSSYNCGNVNYLCESFTPGTTSWRIRASFDEVGEWKLKVHAADIDRHVQYPTIKANSVLIQCRRSDRPGYIRIKDSKYLQRTTGENLIPVGINLGWSWSLGPDEYGTEAYDVWMTHMADNGMNYARVWLGFPWGFSLSGYDDQTGVLHPLNSNQKDAAQIDRIFELADERGIDLMLSIFNPASFSDPRKPGDPWFWRDFSAWNSTHGGPLDYPFDIFQGYNDGYVKQCLRYIVSRWGYSNRLSSYELWNEVDQMVSDLGLVDPSSPEYGSIQQRWDEVIDWHNRMMAYVKSIDVHHHLVTTSTAAYPSTAGDLGGFFEEVAMDFTQTHQYWHMPDNVEMSRDAFFRAHTMHEFYGIPHIHGEVGSGDDPEMNALDPMGFELHAGNWSSLFSGSLGVAELWSWDKYIDVEHADLYSDYAGLTEYARMMTPYVSEQMVPGTSWSGDFDVYFLADKELTKDYFGWVRAKNHSWDVLWETGTMSHDLAYLISMDPGHKPTINTSNKYVVLPVFGNNRDYIVDWYDVETGGVIASSTVESQSMDGSTQDLYWEHPIIFDGLVDLEESQCEGVLKVPIPSIINASDMGDIAFHCYLDCEVTDWQSGDLVEYAYPTTQEPIVANASGDKVFYVNSSGTLNCIYWNAAQSRWDWSDMDNVGVGVRTNIVVTNDEEIFYGAINYNMVRCYYANGAWHTQGLASIASDVDGPLAYSEAANQIFYRTEDDRLKGIYWDWNDSHWHGTDLDQASGAEVSTAITVGPTGQIFYRTTNGKLHSLYWNGQWYWSELGSTGNNVHGQLATDAAGKVFYVNNSGGINCLYFDNGWYWSGLNNAVTSGASGHLVESNGQIFYNDENDHINNIYFSNNSWHMSPLDGATWAKPASQVPMTSDANSQVFYVDDTGEIRRLAYRNQCAPISERVLRSMQANASEDATADPNDPDLEGDATRLEVYPNPTTDIAWIRATLDDVADMEVITVDGKRTEARMVRTDEVVGVDLSSLATGCYWVRITKSNGQARTAMVMKK